MVHRLLSLTLVAAVATAVACGRKPERKETASAAAPDRKSEALLRPRLDAIPPYVAGDDGAGTRHGKTVRAFYEANGFKPVWAVGGKPTPQAQALVASVRKAEAEGLRLAEYDLPDPGQVAKAASWNPLKSGMGDDAAADLELRLSYAFVKYASHLASGRTDPKSVDSHWFVTPRKVDAAAVLKQALDSGKPEETLRSLAPQPRVRSLRETRPRYRYIAAAAAGMPCPRPADEAVRVARRRSAARAPGGDRGWPGRPAVIRRCAFEIRGAGRIGLPRGCTTSRPRRREAVRARHGLNADGRRPPDPARVTCPWRRHPAVTLTWSDGAGSEAPSVSAKSWHVPTSQTTSREARSSAHGGVAVRRTPDAIFMKMENVVHPSGSPPTSRAPRRIRRPDDPGYLSRKTWSRSAACGEPVVGGRSAVPLSTTLPAAAGRRTPSARESSCSRTIRRVSPRHAGDNPSRAGARFATAGAGGEAAERRSTPARAAE